MSALEAIRSEIAERRERLGRLHFDEAEAHRRAERLELQLAREKKVVANLQARVNHDERAIEALQEAVAILTERLPEPLEEQQAPGPETQAEAEVEVPTLRRVPPGTEPPRAAFRVLNAAEELDLESLSRGTLERAEQMAKVLVREGVAMRHGEMATHLAAALNCAPTTAASYVSICLPVLVAQGRVRFAGEAVEFDRRYPVWEATPPERASAGIGVGPGNYEGRTTSWPKPSTSPGKQTRISVETQAFEQGRKR